MNSPAHYKVKTGVILAAGIGERLDIFETNKPLVKLGGTSLILLSIERFKEVGIEDIYVVIRKEDRLIRKELAECNDLIQFIEQQYHEKGMLGALLSVKQVDIRLPFVVAPCDLLFEKNPLSLFDKPLLPDSMSVLISTSEANNLLSGGNEKLSFSNGIINYVESPERFNALDVGIYRFTAKSYSQFVKTAEANDELNKAVDVFQACSCIEPVVMDGIEWFDINTPETLIKAELFLQRQVSPGKIVKPLEATLEPLSVTTSFKYSKPIHFDVHVSRGIIDKIGKYEIIPHEYFYSPHHILIDRNIDVIYGQKICDQLVSLGYQINKHLLDPGEASKSIPYFATIAEDILVKGIEKKSIIISVGGGVIKDLAGFLASTLYRGIGFISFPTTILSQCDAAIALKQGVNGIHGKNLIGSYYSPMKVIVDPAVLATLNERYIYDGLAECLKQAFAQDRHFYDVFDRYQGEIGDINFLEKVITRSIELKVSSIQHDFFEEGASLVNQYGHEIGHAIEYLSGYQLLHGESVAIGMRVSAELSHIMGIAEKEVIEAHIDLLRKFHLPVDIPIGIASEDIINTLRYNKKFHGGKARLVLVSNIGSLWHDGSYYSVYCSDELLEEAINKSYA
jgi:3-dehydroquinate synthase